MLKFSKDFLCGLVFRFFTVDGVKNALKSSCSLQPTVACSLQVTKELNGQSLHLNCTQKFSLKHEYTIIKIANNGANIISSVLRLSGTPFNYQSSSLNN